MRPSLVLFSDYYLYVTLPGWPGWRALAGEADGLMVKVRGSFMPRV